MMKRLLPGALVALLSVHAGVCGAEPVTWDFPRTRNCHEGMPFSDGVTGVLVWGGDSTLNLTVGRADLWDHRGGYPWLASQSYTNILAAVESGDADRLLGLFKKETPAGEPRNPYMLPLGRVVVTFGGGWKLASGTLDPMTGLGELKLRNGDREISVPLAMSKRSRAFAMDAGSVPFEVRVRPSTDFPVWKTLEPIGFRPARVWRDEEKGAAGGFIWELPADLPVSLAWSRRGGEFALVTARGTNAATAEAGFAQVRDESVRQWKAFWDKGAKVKVPDPVIQRMFDFGMYKFGAMTDPDGVPAGLQGPWLEDDKRVPWNGDYHFNINVQECYSPAFRGGHLDHLKPLFRMVLGWRPRLRANAKLFCGIDDGYTLPHSVDDRGVCIGGFWTGTIDHGSTAWVAAMMYKYVRYSGDVAFLRDGAYDFMKGAMNVYLKLFEERDGRLSLPMGPSPEWGGASPKGAVGRDPSFQLACAHRLARELVDAATLLKCEAPDPRWLDVERRLPPFTKGRGGIILFEGQPFTESHRHHSHMAGLYPFDTIDLADKAVRRTVYETYETWTAKGTGAWSGWCVPWASILHTHVGNAVAAVEMLRAWDAFYCDEGHGSHHNAVHNGFTTMCWGNDIMQMDGQCAATAAVLELLVHETNGKTNFFRGCPASWKEVSFENVRLSDGRRASGRRLNGEVSITYSGSETQPLARL